MTLIVFDGLNAFCCRIIRMSHISASYKLPEADLHILLALSDKLSFFCYFAGNISSLVRTLRFFEVIKFMIELIKFFQKFFALFHQKF